MHCSVVMVPHEITCKNEVIVVQYHKWAACWTVVLLKPSNMTYTYDYSGHGNDYGKVNYVADNKMP